MRLFRWLFPFLVQQLLISCTDETVPTVGEQEQQGEASERQHAEAQRSSPQGTARVIDLVPPKFYYETQAAVRRYLASEPRGELPVDGWGQQMKVVEEAIRSAGPDRKFDTEDDVVFGPSGEFLPAQAPGVVMENTSDRPGNIPPE